MCTHRLCRDARLLSADVQFIMQMLRSSVFLGWPCPEQTDVGTLCTGTVPACICLHVHMPGVGRSTAPPQVLCIGGRQSSSCPRLLDFGTGAFMCLRSASACTGGMLAMCSWQALKLATHMLPAGLEVGHARYQRTLKSATRPCILPSGLEVGHAHCRRALKSATHTAGGP